VLVDMVVDAVSCSGWKRKASVSEGTGKSCGSWFQVRVVMQKPVLKSACVSRLQMCRASYSVSPQGRAPGEPLFSVTPVLKKVIWELGLEHPPAHLSMLKDAKAYLLCMENRYAEALEVYTMDPQPREELHFDVFKLIEDYEMFSMVANEASILALLVTHEEKVCS